MHLYKVHLSLLQGGIAKNLAQGYSSARVYCVISYGMNICFDGSVGEPSNYVGDLENLLAQGYLLKRETVIGDGKTLLVLKKAE